MSTDSTGTQLEQAPLLERGPEQVYALITAEGRPQSVPELQARMMLRHYREVPRATMNRWVKELRRAGRLVRVGYGRYGLPAHAEGPPNMSYWVAKLFHDNPSALFDVSAVGKRFKSQYGFGCPREILESMVDLLARQQTVLRLRKARFQWSGKNPLPIDPFS